MDKKTSFVLYPADFLAAVHNFKKSQIADLIIALCEINFYGEVSFKLSDPIKKRFTAIQDIIEKNNAKYKEICEKRQVSGAKGGSKRQAKLKITANIKQKFYLPTRVNRRMRMNLIMYMKMEIKIKGRIVWISRNMSVRRVLMMWRRMHRKAGTRLTRWRL